MIKKRLRSYQAVICNKCLARFIELTIRTFLLLSTSTHQLPLAALRKPAPSVLAQWWPLHLTGPYRTLNIQSVPELAQFQIHMTLQYPFQKSKRITSNGVGSHLHHYICIKICALKSGGPLLFCFVWWPSPKKVFLLLPFVSCGHLYAVYL